MAERIDVGVGMATPNLDPFHELPANTGTSTLGASSTGTAPATSTGTSAATGMGSNLGSNSGSLGNMGSLGGTGSGQSTSGTSGQNPGDPSHQGVAQQVKNLAGEAKDQTVKVAEQARDHVQNLVSQQKDQAAEHLGSLASALREAGRKLEEGEKSGGFGRYADQAGEQVERLSIYLRDSDLSGFVRDTESFARRRPEVFLGGALLAGLALARFLKASSPNRGSYGDDGGNRNGEGQAYSSSSSHAGTGRSSSTPERRNPGEVPAANFADAGTTPYNAPLGI
jgi:hypothetical protein